MLIILQLFPTLLLYAYHSTGVCIGLDSDADMDIESEDLDSSNSDIDMQSAGTDSDVPNDLMSVNSSDDDSSTDSESSSELDGVSAKSLQAMSEATTRHQVIVMLVCFYPLNYNCPVLHVVHVKNSHVVTTYNFIALKF